MSKVKKNKEKVRSSLFIMIIFSLVSKIYLSLFYKVKFNRKALKEQKRGCILIYNHYSNKDHYLISAATNCRRINYVLSGHFFFNKVLATILNLAKSIKKDQFKPDLVAIRKIRKVLDQNGIIAIAPAGQVSINGAPIYISPAIVKLIRMCKSDVLALRMQGGHLCFPKWRLTKRKCRMNVTFSKVLNYEDIDTLTDDEIYNKVVESIRVHEYEDQLTMKRVIKGKNIISGLENELIKCPNCGEYYTNVTEKNMMKCTHCGNTVIMDKYGLLSPLSEKDVCFKNEVDWYEYQKQELKKELDDPNFKFCAKVKMSRNLTKEDEMEYVGDGVLTLTKDRFYYEGKCLGNDYLKEFNYNQLVQLPFSIAPLDRQYVEVPDSEGVFSFVPIEQAKVIIRFVQYIDIINENRK